MGLIYVLVFLGFFAGALVSPVLSPMFLHPQDHGVLSAETSPATRAFLLGVAMAVFRVGEFLGSPILGQLSDKFGRKMVLAAAMGITSVGNLAIAWAISVDQFWIIVAGQFFLGFVGVLLVLAQAEVANFSVGPEKSRRFGLIYMASSLAYVFAPVIGGHLADQQYFPWASYSVPFYVAAVVCLVCTGLILYRFPEPSLSNSETESDGIHLTRGFMEMGEAFKLAPFRALLIVNFFLYLGIDFVFQFNPVYFVQKWEFTSSHVGWLLSYTSVSMVMTQWLLIKPISKGRTPRTITAVCAVALSGLLILEILPNEWWWLCLILPCVGAAMALATTNMSALLSDTAPPDAQGRMLGVSHSIRVLGSALLCFCGGILAGLSPQYPILVGAVASIIAAALLWFYRPKTKTKSQATL